MKYENVLIKLGYDFIILIILIALIALITKNLYVTISFILLVSITIIFFSTWTFDNKDKQNFTKQKDIFYTPSQGQILEIFEDNSNIIISIFLNITDNHKQYIPIKSRYIQKNIITGRNYPAYKILSRKNNTVENILESVDYNFKYKIIQRTGILTRRIKTFIDSNSTILLPGEDLGFIILGSRVEVELPKRFVKNILINKNDYVTPMTPMIQLI